MENVKADAFVGIFEAIAEDFNLVGKNLLTIDKRIKNTNALILILGGVGYFAYKGLSSKVKSLEDDLKKTQENMGCFESSDEQ